MDKSAIDCPFKISGSCTERNRSLSHASEALEINSRRKTSLLEYRELTIKSINRLTSAWYSKVSPSCCSVLLEALTTTFEDVKEEEEEEEEEGNEEDDGKKS